MGNHLVFVDAPRESVKPILDVVASDPHKYVVCYDVDDDPPENVLQALQRIIDKIKDIEKVMQTHKGPWPVVMGTSPHCLAVRYKLKFSGDVFEDTVSRLMRLFKDIDIGYVRVATEDEEDKAVFDLLKGTTIYADSDDATIIDACTGDLIKFEALCFSTTHSKPE